MPGSRDILEVLGSFVVVVYAELQFERHPDPNLRIQSLWWTGFIVNTEYGWMLVSAGHTAKDLAEANRQGGTLTSFGVHSLSASPMSSLHLIEISKNHIGGSVYRDGIDASFILLPETTAKQLYVCGLTPIPLEDIVPPEFEPEACLLVGVVAETARLRPATGE